MQDSSREERARRILQWVRDNRTWTGNYDFYEVSGLFDGPVTQMMVTDPMGLPPVVTRQELIEKIFRSPKLVQRMQHAKWLLPLPDLGTRESYFSREDAYRALERILKGERPPRLPSEPELQDGKDDL